MLTFHVLLEYIPKSHWPFVAIPFRGKSIIILQHRILFCFFLNPTHSYSPVRIFYNHL